MGLYVITKLVNDDLQGCHDLKRPLIKRHIYEGGGLLKLGGGGVVRELGKEGDYVKGVIQVFNVRPIDA